MCFPGYFSDLLSKRMKNPLHSWGLFWVSVLCSVLHGTSVKRSAKFSDRIRHRIIHITIIMHAYADAFLLIEWPTRKISVLIVSLNKFRQCISKEWLENTSQKGAVNWCWHPRRRHLPEAEELGGWIHQGGTWGSPFPWERSGNKWKKIFWRVSEIPVTRTVLAISWWRDEKLTSEWKVLEAAETHATERLAIR